MRTFIQLRDGIGYATVNTTGEPDHSVTPDHTTVVEVFTDNPEQFLCKKYNSETSTWTDTPIIKYAIVDEEGFIVEFKSTFFESEIKNNPIINSKISGSHKWDGTSWYVPESIQAEPLLPVVEEPTE